MATKIINYVRKSVLDTEVVQSSVGFKLPAMNATRWNSQHRLLQKLIEALDTIHAFSKGLRRVPSMALLSRAKLKC